jgi:hypothetical protein
MASDRRALAGAGSFCGKAPRRVRDLNADRIGGFDTYRVLFGRVAVLPVADDRYPVCVPRIVSFMIFARSHERKRIRCITHLELRK